MPLIPTIDIEDWAQSTLDPDLPITARSERNVHYLLDILADENIKATCFVLGKFAERFPDCVRRIANDGHEVASHGYGHVDIVRQTPEMFREDVRRSKQHLEQITGQPVHGYRAPDFSLVSGSLCLLNILAEEGFMYDSSINPAMLSRFGVPFWPKHPVRVGLRQSNGIIEMPVATLTVAGRALPVAGGGYHRLLPWFVIRRLIAAKLAAQALFVYYCHPYEFDTREFENLGFPIPLKTRLHQGLGRRGFESKFRRMVRLFETATAVQVLRDSVLPDYTLLCENNIPQMHCKCCWKPMASPCHDGQLT